MKSLITTILVLFTISIHAQQQVMTIKAMTYNIRYDNPDDGENAWKHRKAALTEFINTQSPDFFGLQEALVHQIEDIDRACEAYNWVGAGRDDGNKNGEFSPIFYKKNTFNVLNTGTFWLSETSDVIGSKGWDAVLPRVATWIKLEHRLTQKTFLIVNTHFDHKGSWARVKSAELILNKVKTLQGGASVVIMGDLNITPHDEVYRLFTQNSGFEDTKELSRTPPIESNGTFNGFKNNHFSQRIDYIFTSPFMKVNTYQVLQPKYGNNRQVSDHYPVVITLQ